MKILALRCCPARCWRNIGMCRIRGSNSDSSEHPVSPSPVRLPGSLLGRSASIWRRICWGRPSQPRCTGTRSQRMLLWYAWRICTRRGLPRFWSCSPWCSRFGSSRRRWCGLRSWICSYAGKGKMKVWPNSKGRLGIGINFHRKIYQILGGVSMFIQKVRESQESEFVDSCSTILWEVMVNGSFATQMIALPFQFLFWIKLLETRVNSKKMSELLWSS